MREFIPLPEDFQRAEFAPGGRFQMTRASIPELGRGDLLFRLLAAGVSPSERPSASATAGSLVVNCVGDLAAVGDGVSGWSPLDRALVVVQPGTPDTEPASPLAEFVHVPGSRLRAAAQGERIHVLKVPDGFSSEDATLLPATATASRLLREAAIPAGGGLVVVGLGIVGQLLVLLARHQRVERIVAADPSPTLRAKAEWSGATRVVRIPDEPLGQAALETGPFQAAVILLPDAACLGDASRLLGRGGVLLVAAAFPPGLTLNVAPAWLRRGEIRMQGVQGFEDRDLRNARRAVEQGIVNAENFVSKRIAWKDLGAADLAAEYWVHGTHVVVEGPE